MAALALILAAAALAALAGYLAHRATTDGLLSYLCLWGPALNLALDLLAQAALALLKALAKE